MAGRFQSSQLRYDDTIVMKAGMDARGIPRTRSIRLQKSSGF